VVLGYRKQELFGGRSQNMGNEQVFEELLDFLNRTYKTFPKFLIEIMAENHGIPPSETKTLIEKFRKSGHLAIIRNEGYYFTLNKD